MDTIKDHFLLDPHVTFLNHGSFGATPRPVFEAYQAWQLRLERQPVLFLGREIDSLFLQSRQALGKFLGAQARDLVYTPNATHGVNIAARSLRLQPGDEVLTSDHEYGACDYTWEYLCGRAGSKYIHQHIPLPAASAEDIVEEFWQGVTPRTKAIFVSHITSPTALRLPVRALCKRARQAGILTIIDAAHSPGQIPLNLQALGADFVFGNCHKWMLAPKGAAFFYARQETQALIEPFVVSWGYKATPETTTGSRFVDLLQWTGTDDPAAALTVPAAIQFMQTHNWQAVRRSCRILLRQAVERVCQLTGQPPVYPLTPAFISQMAAAPLPAGTDLAALKRRLYDEFRVEVPLIQWQDRKFVRISIQAYNTQQDVDMLIHALGLLLPQTC